MRFAISIPQLFPDGELDAADFRAHLARAEELGFDSAWAQENTLGSAPVLGPLGTMSFAAACTSELRLGCAVFVSSMHSPVHLAKEISTIDQLSGGRVEVGFAAGGPGGMASAFGVAPSERIPRFIEGLRVMKACWAESSITFEGRFWQLDGAAMEPKPVQKPHPRVWLGGSHPGALRRVAEYGGGFFGAGMSTTEQFAEQVRIVRAELAEAGRDAAGLQIAKRVYVAVEDDPARARAQLDRALHRLYGQHGLLDVAVAGTAEECADGLSRVSSAGAELIQLHPLYDEREQMERLASDVIPGVRAGAP